MHKDVKIGVVVGIVLAVGVVGYILFAGSAQNAGDLLTEKTLPADQVNVPVTRADEPKPTSKSHESDMPDLIIPRMAMPKATPTTAPAAITLDLPEPTILVPKMAPEPEPAAPMAGDIEIIELVAEIPTRISVMPQIYVVAAEDTRGYWGIAEKVYGHGKHYELIERANPTVNPSELRPGQKLILPPLASAATSRTKIAAASTASTSGKGKVYVVQEGDSFWKIASKHYGRGDYWYLIDQANPSTRPGSVIRPGKKLIIPPLPSKAIKPVGSAGKTAISLIGGGTYVVKPGDSFWTIAQANYGHGKYESVIAKANPSIDSRKLKPGQKLTLPPRSAVKLTPVKSAKTGSASAGSEGGPVFENYKDY